MVGEIYLAKIYFTDLSDFKLRPVLVVKTFHEDCMCLQLTTNLSRNGILIDNNSLVDGFMKKNSIIVLPKSFTLHKSIFIKYIGKLNSSILELVYTELCKGLGCSK